MKKQAQTRGGGVIIYLGDRIGKIRTVRTITADILRTGVIARVENEGAGKWRVLSANGSKLNLPFNVFLREGVDFQGFIR